MTSEALSLWAAWIHRADVILAGLAICWLVWVIKIKKSRNGKLVLPPGPPGLPLLGNVLSLETNLHLGFSKLAKKYGPIIKLQFGSKVYVILSSEAVVKEMFRDNAPTFSNRDVGLTQRIISYDGNDVVFSPYGDTWRLLRKLCVRELLNNSNVDASREVRKRELRRTLIDLYGKSGTAVNLHEAILRTIFSTMTSTLWGSPPKGEDGSDTGKEFDQVAAEATELVGKPNLSDYFPFLARFDLQGAQRRMTRLLSWFDRIFQSIVDQKLKTIRAEQKGKSERQGNKDFLDILLEIMEKQDPKTPLNLLQIKATLLDMVLAGIDTSSTTLEWAFSELLQHPEMMKRVQDELVEVVGKDNFVNESHLSKLHYLDAVVKETLRFHPAIPLLIPRPATMARTIGGYDIPEGCSVWVNVYSLHMDPTAWENPTEFRPERFLNSLSNRDYNGNDLNYLPFGSGRRVCAGIPLAEKMLNSILASFLQSFDWRLPEGTKLDLSEKFGFALKKAIPLVAIPTPRLPNPEQWD